VKKILFLLILLGLALTGTACWITNKPAEPANGAYTLATVETGTLVDTISSTGILQPNNVLTVGTELAGQVVEVAADFNQTVSEGDLLFRLDDTVARQRLADAERAVAQAGLAVEQAKVAYDYAQKTLERLRGLTEKVSMKKELEAAEFQTESARLTLELAKGRVKEAEGARSLAELALKKTVVRVPVRSADATLPAGIGTLSTDDRPTGPPRTYIVLDRKIMLGQQIGPPLSAQAFTLASDLRQMQVQAQVAEGDIGKVRTGMKGNFTVGGTGEDKDHFPVTVASSRLLPVSGQGARYYEVLLDVENQRDDSTGEWKLRPGMTATVDLAYRQHEQVWKVPLAALNLVLDEKKQSDAARAKLARWRQAGDTDKWKVVWTLGADNKPWPLLVRTGGVDRRGQTGIQDAEFEEVLEWDAEWEPRPDLSNRATWPRVIIAAPPPSEGGWFKLPPVKL
jgi:HlyD family secretion protein